MNTADIDPLLHPLKDLLPVLIDGDRREGQSFRLSEFPSTMPEMFSDALRSGVEVAYHKIPVSSLYFESRQSQSISKGRRKHYFKCSNWKSSFISRRKKKEKNLFQASELLRGQYPYLFSFLLAIEFES